MSLIACFEACLSSFRVCKFGQCLSPITPLNSGLKEVFKGNDRLSVRLLIFLVCFISIPLVQVVGMYRNVSVPLLWWPFLLIYSHYCYLNHS